MGEGEEKQVAAAASDPRVIRIFVGGLSASVTAADIEKTFSSLGRVGSVEFIRKNGRNFAYMDFEPNSDKSLAKIFSTYNGCTWKGGKLKLERAKEHYLARLNREWAEDAKLMSASPVDPNVKKDAGNSKSDRLNMEDMQLRIFFPKLRKVKSLPFKGTGKHKYSFQRIEVPSLPIHFCDCEDHREPSETASQKYLSSLSTGIFYEKELSIMNSVMSKLFEKEDNEMTEDRVTELATGANISDPSINDIHSEETEEALGTDADNLVTNIGMGRREDILMQLGGETQSADQDSRFGKLRPCKDGLAHKKTNSQKRQKTGPTDASEVTANQQAHPILSGKISEDEFAAILPRNISSECQQENFAEPSPGKSQTELSTSTTQSMKGNSWLQKSSWRDLVGETRNGSFSISHVLPEINSVSGPKSTESAVVISAAEKRRKAQPGREKSKTLPVMQGAQLEKAVAPGHDKMTGKEEKIQANPVGDEHKEPQKTGDQETRRTIPKVSTSEVCTFMRSAESEKEWTKARAALSGYLKKKGNENDASKSLKRMPPGKR